MALRKCAKVLCLLLVVIMLVGGLSGCSTFYHWERVGMPKSERGDVDVGMIIINIFATFGLGIVVDAMTGAMWVPKGKW